MKNLKSVSTSVPVSCAIFYRRSRDQKEFEVALFERTEPEFSFEFPGGKIEVGESAEEALIREIDEELGVPIQIIKKLGVNSFSYDRKDIELHCYFVETQNEFILREHRTMVWVNSKNWQNLTVSKADIAFLQSAFVELPSLFKLS